MSWKINKMNGADTRDWLNTIKTLRIKDTMTTLLFARHGQASFGQSNYDKLSPLGEKQAALLGSHYGSTQRKIDAIVSGSLVRQQFQMLQL